MVRMTANSDTAAYAAARANVTLTVATLFDLPEVLAVQRAGFMRVAQTAGIDPAQMAPLRETLEDLAALYTAGVTTFVAWSDDAAAGTVRATRRDDGAIEIGRLAVADGFLRRGIATALMRTLEESFPEARRFELFTGAEAAAPLALYARLGYHIFAHEDHGSWQMVWLAKDGPAV